MLEEPTKLVRFVAFLRAANEPLSGPDKDFQTYRAQNNIFTAGAVDFNSIKIVATQGIAHGENIINIGGHTFE